MPELAPEIFGLLLITQLYVVPKGTIVLVFGIPSIGSTVNPSSLQIINDWFSILGFGFTVMV